MVGGSPWLVGCQGYYWETIISVGSNDRGRLNSFQIFGFWRKSWSREVKYCSTQVPQLISPTKDDLWFPNCVNSAKIKLRIDFLRIGSAARITFTTRRIYFVDVANYSLGCRLYYCRRKQRGNGTNPSDVPTVTGQTDPTLLIQLSKYTTTDNRLVNTIPCHEVITHQLACSSG